MIPFLVTALSPIVGDLLNRLVPDKAGDAKLQAEINLRLAEAANEVLKGQVETNKIEAASPNVFVSGWRPFIGWVCGAALAWTFLGHDLATWIAVMFARDDLIPPAIDSEPLFELVLAMLGLGGLRTFEKLKKVAR